MKTLWIKALGLAFMLIPFVSNAQDEKKIDDKKIKIEDDSSKIKIKKTSSTSQKVHNIFSKDDKYDGVKIKKKTKHGEKETTHVPVSSQESVGSATTVSHNNSAKKYHKQEGKKKAVKHPHKKYHQGKKKAKAANGLNHMSDKGKENNNINGDKNDKIEGLSAEELNSAEELKIKKNKEKTKVKMKVKADSTNM